MEKDQDVNQDQVNTDEEVKKDETNQDQADQQDQDKSVDSIAKEKEALEKRFKSETAGLNRRIAEMEKAIKEKEREGLDEVERAKAELDDAKAEQERIKSENNNLRKKRVIDSALYSAELPAELFEDRIVGESDDEIKADVEKVKAYITDHIEKEVEKRVKDLLKGKDPNRQDQTVDGVLTLEEIAALPTREARTAARRAAGYE